MAPSHFFTYSLLMLLHLNLQAQKINIESIQKHVTYLASDELEGRAPGTKGEKLAIQYISAEFAKLGLTPMGTNGFQQKFDYKYNKHPHDSASKTFVKKKGSNVVGFLDNKAASTIVIGGHFDHLGIGHHHSARDTSKGVHNGADDNASGTAGVIELANYFVNNKKTEANNFLFICFSAEEDGLVGSKHFTSNPTLKIEDINCMINMDMIGRLDQASKKLMVYGYGTSPAFAGIIDTNDKRFSVVIDSSGMGPTDHTSFYLKNIPVLSFFTGQHNDYHKASDDVDKINFEGEQMVLEYIAEIVQQIDTKGKLTFTATKNKEQGRSKYKVTLGIMPDYTADVSGVRVDGVMEGKSAENAGILSGDIIIEMDGNAIKDIYAYMKQLAAYKKDDTCMVLVQRGEQKLKLKVKF